MACRYYDGQCLCVDVWWGVFGRRFLGEHVWLVDIWVREVSGVDVWVLGSGMFVPPRVGVHRVKIMMYASVKITDIIAHSLVF